MLSLFKCCQFSVVPVGEFLLMSLWVSYNIVFEWIMGEISTPPHSQNWFDLGMPSMLCGIFFLLVFVVNRRCVRYYYYYVLFPYVVFVIVIISLE